MYKVYRGLPRIEGYGESKKTFLEQSNGQSLSAAFAHDSIRKGIHYCTPNWIRHVSISISLFIYIYIYIYRYTYRYI
jgi:hypothetical protein